KEAADGRVSLHLENLAPKETFCFELLSVNQHLPSIVNVCSEQSIGNHVELVPQIVPKFWKIRLLLMFASLGLCTSISMLAVLIQVLAISRPVAFGG
ncbi:MAG: hypothetical protein M3438_00875, partial [Pseudomonadota bacterium]|nr:hypothetical protein [Pseudomonadota bacterium]